MSYLIKHQWGYQTCCPDEENTVGYFKPENPDEIKLYSRPSFDSQILKKQKISIMNYGNLIILLHVK